MYSIVISMYIWRRLRRLSSTNRPWHWKKKKNTTRERFFTLPHPPFVLDVHFVLFFSFTRKQKKEEKNQVFFIAHTPSWIILTRLWVVFYNKNTSSKEKKEREENLHHFSFKFKVSIVVLVRLYHVVYIYILLFHMFHITLARFLILSRFQYTK